MNQLKLEIVLNEGRSDKTYNFNKTTVLSKTVDLKIQPVPGLTIMVPFRNKQKAFSPKNSSGFYIPEHKALLFDVKGTVGLNDSAMTLFGKPTVEDIKFTWYPNNKVQSKAELLIEELKKDGWAITKEQW